MGKPFKQEIERLQDTIQWASDQSIDLIYEFIIDNPLTPLFVVGSGGSLSACILAASLYQKTGIMAKAITPLELNYSKEALNNSKILFISSSGKNSDILFAFKVAIMHEPKAILTVCMKKDNPLSQLASQYTISKSVDYDIPTKKDGFLATNSLVAYFVLLCKAFKINLTDKKNDLTYSDYNLEIQNFVSKLSFDHSIIVLYGGWGESVAYDIESKFTESALGNVIITDYRNFGHGRHHWFAKRKKVSSIIAIVSPSEKEIALKTLKLIPEDIPKLVIQSNIKTAFSAVDLLIKSFYLVSSMGELLSIDPGRPSVPDFGRKLYHLRYSSFYKSQSLKPELEQELHIKRKIGFNGFNKLSDIKKNYWIEKYQTFNTKLKNANFGIIIFDYDGTICPNANRFSGIPDDLKNIFLKLLTNEIVVGIATGRGKSVLNDFNQWVPVELKSNLIIACHNGSEVGGLDKVNEFDKHLKQNKSLEKLKLELERFYPLFNDCEMILKPSQLTVLYKTDNYDNYLPYLLRTLLKTHNFEDIEMLESSHSYDFIITSEASKLNIIEECIKKARIINKKTEYLCIGDMGQWPGNDYKLLSTPFSLSVDQVSLDPETCWNLSSVGLRNYDATLQYLKRLKINKGNIKFT